MAWWCGGMSSSSSSGGGSEVARGKGMPVLGGERSGLGEPRRDGYETGQRRTVKETYAKDLAFGLRLRDLERHCGDYCL